MTAVDHLAAISAALLLGSGLCGLLAVLGGLG